MGCARQEVTLGEARVLVVTARQGNSHLKELGIVVCVARGHSHKRVVGIARCVRLGNILVPKQGGVYHVQLDFTPQLVDKGSALPVRLVFSHWKEQYNAHHVLMEAFLSKEHQPARLAHLENSHL